MSRRLREESPATREPLTRVGDARRSAAASPLFDSIPFPSLLVGDEGRISAVNRTFEDRFGKSEDELLGSSVTLVAGPYGDKSEGGALLSAVNDGYGLVELTGFDSGGMAFPCVVTVSALLEPVGGATRLVTIRETSEMQRLKANLSVVEQAARREKQLLRAVAEPLDDIVIALDDSERVVLVNDAACEGFALSAEGIRGRGLIDLELPGSIRGVWLAFLASSEAVATKTVRVPLRGDEQTLLLQFRRARSDAGSPLGSVLIARTLATDEKLGPIPRSRRPAALCHDLRTRLSSIQGFSRAMLDEPSMDAETRREFISIVAAETERLGALLESLLTAIGSSAD